MKYIREYQIFEASASAPQTLTAVQIDWLDKCTEGSWKYNPQTGFVDLHAYKFDCRGQGLTDLKGVKFGEVSGYFYCNDNQLTSLMGAPQSVRGAFGCSRNQLTSLEGAPQSVKGDFSCERNELTSLVGAPKTVGGGFLCYDNNLTTLEGAPQVVGGGFSCYDNQLTSLVGAPQSVKWDFRCEDNHLTSLGGAPQSVGGDFNCEDNELTTLVGAPQTVGGHFRCYNNPVSESTLKAIFALMEKGKSYQQALEERWPKMKDVDRVLMYKEMPSLPPEDVRKYKALATYNNIKGYL